MNALNQRCKLWCLWFIFFERRNGHSDKQIENEIMDEEIKLEEIENGVEFVLSRWCMMKNVELFSGGDRDPELWAHVDAGNYENSVGRKIWYDVNYSFGAVKIDRSRNLLDWTEREEFGRQCVGIHLVVYKEKKFLDAARVQGVTIIKTKHESKIN
jgi:hypothetical protein